MAKKVFNIFTTVLLVLLIVLVVLCFLARASGDSLSLFGVRFYRVSSGSMEPTLKEGDIIVVGKTEFKELKKGDIITYKSNKGEMAGEPVTHRVVVEPENRNGRWVLRTQGDASDAPLDSEITPSQLIGKYVCTIPIIGLFYSFFLTPYGLLTLIIVIVVLFGYELISLMLSYKSLDRISDEILEEAGVDLENREESQKTDEE